MLKKSASGVLASLRNVKREAWKWNGVIRGAAALPGKARLGAPGLGG